MLNRIKLFFTPPTFEDEDKTRIARYLNMLSLTILGGAPIALLVFSVSSNLPVQTALLALFIPIAFVNIVLIKKGYVRLSAVILLAASWLIINYSLLGTGGIRAVGFGLNLVLVLAAGLLMNLSTAFAIGVVSSVVGLGMAIAQDLGFLPSGADEVNAYTAWITQSMVLALIVGLLYATVNDIQRSLKRARQAEARLRGLIENTPDFVMELDRVGKVILANRFSDQMVGRDVREFVLAEHIPAVNKTMEESFNAGNQASMEIQTRDLDGRIAWNSVRIGPIVQDGQVASLTVFVSNITERKQAEAEREQLITQLEAQNAELTQFTYTVSHELKTPVVTMKGFVGSISQDLKDKKYERAENDLLRISTAADKMHDTVSDLLELSRIGRLMNEPKDVPFDDLINDAMEIVHGQLEKHNITVQIQPNLPTVHGDHQRLTEILQNLLDNAAKYMGNQTNPLIEIGQNGEENGKPVFFVKDNGIGIALEYRERIFGLFNKLDARSEGTGIGLALVKRIVEVHGGRIWVESASSPQGELEKGSVFYFTLPRG